MFFLCSIFRSLMEENTETVQHMKEERSRREAEISSLNKKVDHLVKDLSDKTGSASEAYTKLNKMHQVLSAMASTPFGNVN